MVCICTIFPWETLMGNEKLFDVTPTGFEITGVEILLQQRGASCVKTVYKPRKDCFLLRITFENLTTTNRPGGE